MAFYGPQAAGGTHRMLSESGGFITQSTIFFFFPVANKEAGPGAGVADHGYRPVGAELGLHRGLLTPYPGSSQRPLLPGALAPPSSPFQLHREGGLRKQI